MKYNGKYSIERYLVENQNSTKPKTAFTWLMGKSAGAQIWEWVIAEQADKNGNHTVSVSSNGDTVTFTTPETTETIGPAAAAKTVFPKGGFLDLVKKMRSLLSDLPKGEVFFPMDDKAHSDIVVKTESGIKEYHAKWNMSDSGRFIGMTPETKKAMSASEKEGYNPVVSNRTTGGYLNSKDQENFYQAINGIIDGSDDTAHQQLSKIRSGLTASDLAAAPTTDPKDATIILNTFATNKAEITKSRRAQQRAVRAAMVKWLTDNFDWLQRYFDARFGSEESGRQNVLLSGKLGSPSDTPTLKTQKIASAVGTKLFAGDNPVVFSEVSSTNTTIKACIEDVTCFSFEARSREKPSDAEVLKTQKNSKKPIEFSGGRSLQVIDVNYDPAAFGHQGPPGVSKDLLPGNRMDPSHGGYPGKLDTSGYERPSTLSRLFEWAVK